MLDMRGIHRWKGMYDPRVISWCWTTAYCTIKLNITVEIVSEYFYWRKFVSDLQCFFRFLLLCFCLENLLRCVPVIKNLQCDDYIDRRRDDKCQNHNLKFMRILSLGYVRASKFLGFYRETNRGLLLHS